MSLKALSHPLPSSTRVTVSDKWFVVDDSSFPFFSLSYPKRYTLALFVFGILIPVIFILIFYFCP
jgi:hypothetical protein